MQKKTKADRRAKKAKKQIEDLKRKRRTHRLIVRGAILEKFIPDAETLSDDDVSSLLSGLLNKPDNQHWMRTWLEAHRTEEPIDSVVVAGTFDEDEEPGGRKNSRSSLSFFFSLPPGLIHEDRRGDRRVQGLHFPQKRNPDQHIGKRNR